MLHVIPVLRRLKQKDEEFQTILDYLKGKSKNKSQSRSNQVNTEDFYKFII